MQMNERIPRDAQEFSLFTFWSVRVGEFADGLSRASERPKEVKISFTCVCAYGCVCDEYRTTISQNHDLQTIWVSLVEYALFLLIRFFLFVIFISTEKK